jgi:non-ribosomal peptide synthetase component F
VGITDLQGCRWSVEGTHWLQSSILCSLLSILTEAMDSLAHSSPTSSENLSVIYGPTNVELWDLTLRDLIELQAKLYHDREAVVFPWQGVRLTYGQLSERSQVVARSLLAAGLQHGDKVGIFAGNCYQYIETFLGAGRIGCPIIVLNNTYTPQELLSAVAISRE